MLFTPISSFPLLTIKYSLSPSARTACSRHFSSVLQEFGEDLCGMMGSVKEVGEGAEKKVMEKSGCWISRIGSCFLRPRVDVPDIGAAGVLCEENMSKNDGSRDQPAVPVFSGSTTVSNAGSNNTSPPKLGDELNFASQLRRFSFSELKFATRDFMPQSFLGRGGFGCVFKGWIAENGTAPVRPGEGLTVAVKQLNHGGLQGHKEWLAEINFLVDLHHPNLVKLFGYCIEDDQRLLVYEFMPRGSLENHLFRRTLPLPWHIRVKIAVGAAKGLAFLHEEAERPVIFRDFKSSNILLDSDYNAKLSDFGLAKDGPVGDQTHISTRVMGTYGYTAPEYVMTGHLTSKSDVYSFGVVLLEMLTGRMPIDRSRLRGKQILVEWARPYLREGQRLYRLIDPRLGGNYSIRGCQKVAQVVRHCLSRDPKARPRMSEVVEALKPVLYLRDMANSQFYQNMKAGRAGSSTNNPNTRDGLRTHGPFKTHASATRNGQLPAKSLSIGEHASPCNPPLDINGSNHECITSGISPS